MTQYQPNIASTLVGGSFGSWHRSWRALPVPSLLIVVGGYATMPLMLLRLAYLGITNAFALLRLGRPSPTRQA
jgi:hypothetical protein